ncbi:protein SSX4-like [Pteropus medius]|uniref:protein SSX4 n=1 Tax=Pteropus vampyrus TaxID=132908 RepID=UPI00196A9674|nr:protein SSX4 [Pteropus giganteus]XP_039729043.1 protein SSX4-like [Pteropus giganteus]
MNRGSSFAKSPGEDSQKSVEKCETFKDICKYFSKEEWAKLGNSQKRTYACLKRNYDTMTGLGLDATLPAFMNPKKSTTKSSENDFDEDQNLKNQDECPQEASNVQQRNHPKEMPMEPVEENDLKPLPVTPGSEPAQNQLCPLGEESASVQQNEKMPESSTGETKVWDLGLQEKESLLIYEDISDTEEDSQL